MRSSFTEALEAANAAAKTRMEEELAEQRKAWEAETARALETQAQAHAKSADAWQAKLDAAVEVSSVCSDFFRLHSPSSTPPPQPSRLPLPRSASARRQ